jgi:tetrahydromethanopterin S-methyltransferase subunit A
MFQNTNGENFRMLKIQVPDGYPPEEGCYLRGNDNSPVVVVVILKWMREKTPADIENLVRVGVESGAALSGTLQTENVGLEKVICNVIANPNIRYLILFGPESPGHLTGDAIQSLYENGVDKKNRIIGAIGPAPYLYNIPNEWIDRFRDQTKLVNLLNEGSAEVLRQAVWTCYQEKPTEFKGYSLYDIGAYQAEPICETITWKIRNPAYAPKTEKERIAMERMRLLVEKLRRRNKEKKGTKNS